MRDAINLLGKTIEIEETQYEITNLNFLPGTNNYYVELEADGSFLNMSLKDLSPHISEQISYKDGNYRKKRFDS
jgi:hypothetical protein